MNATEPVPRWVRLESTLLIHKEQLARFGGPDGIRDVGLLESALLRPVNKWSYERCDLPTLAAAYAFGISRNHPFVDGNKRTAFAVMMIFLRLNGIAFRPKPTEATAAMLELAAGNLDEAALVRWIADRIGG
jgi:death-on-curing protein